MCKPSKLDPCFGGIFRLHLQDVWTNHKGNNSENGCQAREDRSSALKFNPCFGVIFRFRLQDIWINHEGNNSENGCQGREDRPIHKCLCENIKTNIFKWNLFFNREVCYMYIFSIVHHVFPTKLPVTSRCNYSLHTGLIQCGHYAHGSDTQSFVLSTGRYHVLLGLYRLPLIFLFRKELNLVETPFLRASPSASIENCIDPEAEILRNKGENN
jgi:hypothetical protein